MNRRDLLKQLGLAGIVGVVMPTFLLPAQDVQAPAATEVKPLPDGYNWFAFYDRRVFPVYGASGGVAASFISYLLRDSGDGRNFYVLPIEATIDFLLTLPGDGLAAERMERYLDEHADELVNELGNKIVREGVRPHVTMDGGDLGRGRFDGVMLRVQQ